MKLTNTTRIFFPDCKSFITNQSLAAYQLGGHTTGPYPWSRHQQFTDLTLVQEILCQYSPLTILPSNPDTPFDFQATFARWPFSINGNQNFAAFTLRLVPLVGNIRLIESENRSEILDRFWVEPRLTVVQMAKNLIRLEIFRYHYKQEVLPPLAPPAGFQAEITTVNSFDD